MPYWISAILITIVTCMITWYNMILMAKELKHIDDVYSENNPYRYEFSKFNVSNRVKTIIKCITFGFLAALLISTIFRNPVKSMPHSSFDWTLFGIAGMSILCVLETCVKMIWKSHRSLNAIDITIADPTQAAMILDYCCVYKAWTGHIAIYMLLLLAQLILYTF